MSANVESTTKLDHERLDAYAVAVALDAAVVEIARHSPRGHAWLGDQAQRASASVVLNLAEAMGRERAHHPSTRKSRSHPPATPSAQAQSDCPLDGHLLGSNHPKGMDMSVEEQVESYLAAQPESKRLDMQALHRMIRELMPTGRLWFLDGKDKNGKVVSNPNIGYGLRKITCADGTSRDFYQIGISANTTGISVHILGIEDKMHLPRKYGKEIEKASVTGYCIKFRRLKDINLPVLAAATHDGMEQTSNQPGLRPEAPRAHGRLTTGPRGSRPPKLNIS